MSKALVVIDVQNIYTNPESELFCVDSKATVKRINQIIESFERKKLPIAYVKHVHKKDGSDLGRLFDFAGEFEDFNFKEGSDEVNYDPNLKVVTGSYEFTKNRYSSFTGTGLNEFLKKNKIDTVVIVGFMTNFCCESTTRDAHGLDYFVDFITDATGAPAINEKLDEKEIRKIVAEFMGAGFARVYDTADYLKQ